MFIRRCSGFFVNKCFVCENRSEDSRSPRLKYSLDIVGACILLHKSFGAELIKLNRKQAAFPHSRIED